VIDSGIEQRTEKQDGFNFSLVDFIFVLELRIKKHI